MKKDTFNDNIEDTNSYKLVTMVEEKSSDIFYNRSRLIVLAVLLAFFAISLIVFSSFEIPKIMYEYSISTNEPNIVYMGESVVLDVNNQSDNKSKKMATLIESANDSLLYSLEREKIGSSISTTIVPVQEGTGVIDIFSALENSKNIKKQALAKKRVSITVCPSFTSDLITSSSISILQGMKYSTNIDFGLGECSTDIVYKSNNTKIAQIDENGIITGVYPGKTEIIVSRLGKTFTIPVVVTTNRIPVKSIWTDQTKLQLMPGDNYRLKTKQMPSNSTSVNIRYTSTDQDVVTVSNSGLIEAKNPGSAVINVSYGSINKNVLIVVDDVGLKQTDATSIDIEKNSIVLKKGTSQRIMTQVHPDTAINRLNEWDSSDYKIAVIDYNGVVYAKEIGSADITVKNGSIVKTIKVTVIQ